MEQNQCGQILGFPVENWTQRKEPLRVKINGQYCRLEPLNPKLHAEPLFEAFWHNNCGETWTYLPYGPFEMLDDFSGWLNKANDVKSVFVIIDLQSSTAQGTANYHDMDLAHGVIEVGGIHYSKQLQKTRAATEAMYLMMRHVFDDLEYRRYQWRCNALNKASRQAAERLGFKFEGIFRQSNVFKDRNRDTAWYSIINSEWPELKIKLEKWLDPHNFDTSGKQILSLKEC